MGFLSRSRENGPQSDPSVVKIVCSHFKLWATEGSAKAAMKLLNRVTLPHKLFQTDFSYSEKNISKENHIGNLKLKFQTQLKLKRKHPKKKEKQTLKSHQVSPSFSPESCKLCRFCKTRPSDVTNRSPTPR